MNDNEGDQGQQTLVEVNKAPENYWNTRKGIFWR